MSTKAKAVPKKQQKPRKPRDEAAFRELDKALDELAVRYATDKKIVEQNIADICMLRASGIEYKAIYTGMHEAGFLQIGYKTFFAYVQEAAKKENAKNAARRKALEANYGEKSLSVLKESIKFVSKQIVAKHS